MKLRDQMKMDMELKGFSVKTQDAYIRYVKTFVEYFGKSPMQMGEDEIRQYLHHLITEKQLSTSHINVVHSALKFFFTTTLQRQWNNIKIPRTKSPKKLPIVLAGSEIKQLLDVTINPKHRAILMTTYAAGLRVSETANLKLEDIDYKRMQIRVNEGKGKKDRYTILSAVNLKLLRDYWTLYRPNTWLFPGESPDKPITTRTIQKVFEISRDKAGIVKPATVHSLRHSFATHLLETGTDIFHIQRLMGHSSPKTTSIYIHVKQEDLLKIVSPLDHLFSTGLKDNG
jgi:integrase/recombinase XerD